METDRAFRESNQAIARRVSEYGYGAERAGATATALLKLPPHAEAPRSRLEALSNEETALRGPALQGTSG